MENFNVQMKQSQNSLKLFDLCCNQLDRQIKITDLQINRLVYQFYDLT